MWDFPAYIINLRRRPERLAAALADLKRGGWDRVFRPPEIFEAYDGWKLPTPKQFGAGMDGAAGCKRSHEECLIRSIQNGFDGVIVLEDDVYLPPDSPLAEQLTALLEAMPDDWDLIQLGYQQWGGSPATVGDGRTVVKLPGSGRLHAYIIRDRPGANFRRVLLERWLSNFGHVDHLLHEIQSQYNCYAPRVPLLGQRECDSDICGAKAKQLGNRMFIVGERPTRRGVTDKHMEINTGVTKVLPKPRVLVADGLPEGEWEKLSSLFVVHRPPRGALSAADLAARATLAKSSGKALAIVGGAPRMRLVTQGKVVPYPTRETTAAGLLANLPDGVRKLFPAERLAVPSANVRNTLVIAPAFGYGDNLPDGARWMLDSAARHGVTVTLVGQGEPFTNLYAAKVPQLWEKTRGLTGFDHVLMVDAIDTLFAGDLTDLFARFDALGHDFVVAGETNDFPGGHLNHPQKGKRFGYLNSGVYLATWAAYCRVMQVMASPPKSPSPRRGPDRPPHNDQPVMWDAYLTGAGITVDADCRLFQCTFGVDAVKDFDWTCRPPVNRATGGTPLIFHANGPAKAHLSVLRALLGYGDLPASRPDAPAPAPAAASAWANGEGEKLWGEVHTRTNPTKDWLDGLTRRIPCGPCKDHFREYVAANPPPYGDDAAFFAWGVTAHNAVNKRRGVPEWAVDEACAKWRVACSSKACACRAVA